MPRTAPAPNAIAIPGMNPGTLVAGGGGDGSGGSGGRGGGNGSGHRGNGQDGGEDATGGGQSAGTCGSGEPGGCNNCDSRIAAGDPVDVSTGRVFTVGDTDVALPGPMPLVLRRRYSSAAVDRDVGLGFGWTHSFAWQIVVKRRYLEVWDGLGTQLHFDIPNPGERIIGSRGWAIENPGQGYAVEIEGLRRWFTPHPTQPDLYVLSHVTDRNGNQITLTYDDRGALAQIDDSVGRTIVVSSDQAGRITRFFLRTPEGYRHEFVDYEYDKNGDLVGVRLSGDRQLRYSYYKKHLLQSATGPDGFVFHYVYDREQRCVETWGTGPEGSLRGLASNVPKVLADGTPAKGFMHVRIEFVDDEYREVIDSVQIRRFFVNARGAIEKGVSSGAAVTRTFDEQGFLLSHTDAVEATTTWVRDDRGRILRQTDALGNVQVIERNASGRPTKVFDGLGTILQADYDQRGNPTFIKLSGGEVILRSYDARGLKTEEVQPNGARTVYEYDAHGNLIRVVQADGSEWTYEYDFLGRCLVQRDPRGLTTLFAYDATGRLTRVTYPNGSVEYRLYNKSGDLVQLQEPDGQVWRAEYVLRRQIMVRAPDGSVIHYAYNREGWLTEITNENGEKRTLAHNYDGKIIEIVDFDGRRTAYDYDARNRLVKYTCGLQKTVTYERDLLGRITRVETDDDTIQFEYDQRSRLVAASNKSGNFRYELNDAGQLAREEHELEGVTHWVEHEYDSTRRRTRMKSSLGHEHAVQRDMLGRARVEVLDGARVEFEFDSVGRELRRLYGDGGAEQLSGYGPEGGYLRRFVLKPGTRRTANGEPDWIGAPPPGEVAKTFTYTLDGENILSRWDNRLGRRDYEYTPREQVAAINDGANTVESYQYDPAGNIFEPAVPRRYAPGNRLLARGSTEYTWDADGALIEKTTRRSDGSEERWQFSWNGQGLLSSAENDDGLFIEYAYDPFARRNQKRVHRKLDDGRLELEYACRYVWDKDRILHEIRQSARTGGDPIIEVRTYAYDEHSGAPLAQRNDVISPQGKTDGAWHYFVNDPIGTPEQLITGDGQVVGQLRRTAWGRTTVDADSSASTDIRFAGQYEDEETGLHYNRYRYYDPDAGIYVSVDPAGSFPDPNVYRYTHNPISWIDPLGLAHHAFGEFTPAGGGEPIQLNGGNLLSSSYDDEPDGYSRAYNEEHGITPFQNLTSRDENGVLLHRTSDTEAQMLRELEGLEAQGLDLTGGNLVIVGEQSPCSSCHRRMQEFAEQRNMTIEYHWLGNPNAQLVRDRSPGVQTYP